MVSPPSWGLRTGCSAWQLHARTSAVSPYALGDSGRIPSGRLAPKPARGAGLCRHVVESTTPSLEDALPLHESPGKRTCCPLREDAPSTGRRTPTSETLRRNPGASGELTPIRASGDSLSPLPSGSFGRMGLQPCRGSGRPLGLAAGMRAGGQHPSISAKGGQKQSRGWTEADGTGDRGSWTHGARPARFRRLRPPRPGSASPRPLPPHPHRLRPAPSLDPPSSRPNESWLHLARPGSAPSPPRSAPEVRPFLLPRRWRKGLFSRYFRLFSGRLRTHPHRARPRREQERVARAAAATDARWRRRP